MQFLEKLYEMENFGLYLFGVIGILIVLFMIVLILGKKDQKKSKEQISEETTNVASEPKELPVTETKEEETTNFAFQDVAKETQVQVEQATVPEEPVTLDSEIKNENLANETFFTANRVLNDELQKDEIEKPAVIPQVVESVMDIESPKKEETSVSVEPIREFDFDALANAISKELESIEKKETQKVEEPKTLDSNFKTFEPVNITESKEEVKEEVKPRPVMPTVFSSVYVNREKEVKEPERTEEPVKPAFDLPKMMDLPKKVDDSEK